VRCFRLPVDRPGIKEAVFDSQRASWNRRAHSDFRSPSGRLTDGATARRSAFAGEFALPVLGRVSMDLIAVNVNAAPQLTEGDWVELDYDLPTASQASGLTQYELLTTLGSRFERIWI